MWSECFIACIYFFQGHEWRDGSCDVRQSSAQRIDLLPRKTVLCAVSILPADIYSKYLSPRGIIKQVIHYKCHIVCARRDYTVAFILFMLHINVRNF